MIQTVLGNRDDVGTRGALYPLCTTLLVGVPIPQNGLQETRGDSGVYAAVWGRGGAVYPPAPSSHWASLSPKTVCPGPGGTGVHPPMCGDGGKRHTRLHHPPTGRPYPPKRSTPDRRDSGAYAVVWGQKEVLYPPAPPSHLASRSPEPLRTRPKVLGCMCRCVGTGEALYPPAPPSHRATLSPHGPLTEGTRV